MNLAEQLLQAQRAELEWRGKYYASQHALRAANRGLARLSRSHQKLKSIVDLQRVTQKISEHYREFTKEEHRASGWVNGNGKYNEEITT